MSYLPDPGFTVSITSGEVIEEVKVRDCTGENTQTLSIEAKAAEHAWAALGEWALSNEDAWLRSATVFWESETESYHLTAYYIYS